MLYDLCAAEGGMCEIAVFLHSSSAQKLGRFRRRVGGHNKPLWAIPLFHRYPASGREYYENSLSQIAQNFSRFQVAVRKPFVVTRGSISNVGFNLWAQELRDVHWSVWDRIGEITPFRIKDARVFPFSPAIFVGRRLEKAAAEKTFITAREVYRDVDVRSMGITAVGLAVRHNGQPVSKTIIYKEGDRHWKVFPFRKEIEEALPRSLKRGENKIEERGNEREGRALQLRKNWPKLAPARRPKLPSFTEVLERIRGN
jgi:hypothetical protein